MVKIKIDREKFRKVEEIVLYILGFMTFLDYSYTSKMANILIVVLLIRKLVYKEDFDCGNEKLKKFLFLFLIIGVFWNFLGGMSYKPARSFIKICRWFTLIFYLYPLVKNNSRVLKIYLSSLLLSYLILLYKVTDFYIKYPTGRAPGFDGINPTGTAGVIASLFAFGLVLENIKLRYKIPLFGVYIFGFFVTLAVKGRSQFIAITAGTIFLIVISFIKNFNLKKLISIMAVIILLFLGAKKIPETQISRFKNMFNTEMTSKNSSNALRLKMWEIARYRIKKNPIFGSGTKYGTEDFKEYATKMPENTSNERFLKNELLTKFNDAHSMYFNTIVDNGIFGFLIIGLWLSPIYFLFKRLKDENPLFLACAGGTIGFLTIGFFWGIWRIENSTLLFFILLSISISQYYNKKNGEKI